MKRSCIIAVTFLILSSPVCAFIRGRSFLMPRSHSVHAERELVGWQEDINLNSDSCCNYAALSINTGYSHSFNASNLAAYFFGADRFIFSGSRVPRRADDDILADYFGLPLDFKSCVKFRPVIQNVFLDFNFFAGLDPLCHGMYVRGYVPFVHTRWNPGLCERIINPGELNHPAGYMASRELKRFELAKSVTDFFRGERAIGDLQPLRFGRINGTRAQTGLSDIHFALGWNPCLTDWYHFGFNVRVVIPTGSTTKSIYFFEPLVGNGRHWGFGLGLTGHTVMWESACNDHSWSIYGDLNATHLFGSRHKRSFDLKKNGSSSRYMLIEELGNPIVQGLQVGGVAAEQQYHGVIMPAINQTTLTVNVDIAFELDMALKLSYKHNNFSWDVGYNLWGRTRERFHARQSLPEKSFALKGDAQIYGFDAEDEFMALNVTQSQATMHAGQGEGNANRDFRNRNGDNAVDENGVGFDATLNIAGNEILLFQVRSDVDIPLTRDTVFGSNQAVFLTDCDIDNFSALSESAVAHTFFTHFNYRWSECRSAIPFIGFGAEVSFDAVGFKRICAVSEWAVWMKMGIAF